MGVRLPAGLKHSLKSVFHTFSGRSQIFVTTDKVYLNSMGVDYTSKNPFRKNTVFEMAFQKRSALRF
jgi:hypothetical protein